MTISKDLNPLVVEYYDWISRLCQFQLNLRWSYIEHCTRMVRSLKACRTIRIADKDSRLVHNTTVQYYAFAYAKGIARDCIKVYFNWIKMWLCFMQLLSGNVVCKNPCCRPDNGYIPPKAMFTATRGVAKIETYGVVGERLRRRDFHAFAKNSCSVTCNVARDVTRSGKSPIQLDTRVEQRCPSRRASLHASGSPGTATLHAPHLYKQHTLPYVYICASVNRKNVRSSARRHATRDPRRPAST